MGMDMAFAKLQSIQMLTLHHLYIGYLDKSELQDNWSENLLRNRLDDQSESWV